MILIDHIVESRRSRPNKILDVFPIGKTHDFTLLVRGQEAIVADDDREANVGMFGNF
ncbi:hypothetical protein D3C75_1386900 [compost metagenome]